MFSLVFYGGLYTEAVKFVKAEINAASIITVNVGK